MTPREQQVLEMVRSKPMRASEIAKKLGVAPSTVGTWMHNLRREGWVSCQPRCGQTAVWRGFEEQQFERAPDPIPWGRVRSIFDLARVL